VEWVDIWVNDDGEDLGCDEERSALDDGIAKGVGLDVTLEAWARAVLVCLLGGGGGGGASLFMDFIEAGSSLILILPILAGKVVGSSGGGSFLGAELDAEVPSMVE